jgi:transketolase
MPNRSETMNAHAGRAAPDVAALKATAARLRGKVLEMSHKAQTAHLGSSLSCCDIVTAA